MATRGFEHVTQADLTRRDLKQQAKAKPSKHRNVKVVVDGEKFDSIHEANHWRDLLVLQRTGQIRNLRLQVPFDLFAPQGDPNDGIAVVVCQYFADFVYEQYVPGIVTAGTLLSGDVWQRVVVDAKGPKKRICPYPLKKKWLFLQDGIEILEV